MGIKLSSLPPDLQRRILEAAGPQPVAVVRRRPRTPQEQPRLRRICSCLFEIFRPDGDYPEHCDGCGSKWPE